MAHDLYGELLARALQRRAPPGHFPAFVTPGEANLLRSQGGGVAPGGGQFMAGGIPAFFSTSDPNPGYGGSSEGMSFGVPGVTATYGGSTGMGPTDMDIALGILGLGEGQAQSPEGHAVGEHGWSFEPTAQEISMAQQTLAQHEEQQRQVQYDEQEARRAAAQKQATIEQDLANQIAAQSRISQALARTPPPITVDPVRPAHTLNLDFAPPAPLSSTYTPPVTVGTSLVEPDLSRSAISQNALAAALESDTLDPSYSTPGQTTPGWDYSSFLAARGIMDRDVPTPPSFTGTISEPGTESFFEESLEQDQTPYSGDTTDAGTQAQATAQSILDAQAQAAALSIESGFGNLDAQAAAVAATGQDPTAGNVDNTGQMTEQGLANVAQNIGMNDLAQGRFSPASSWGALSEVAQQNIERGRPTGVTAGMIAALNAQDHQGYAINNPQPSEASILASQVFAQLNPTITNAVIGLASLVAPGPAGFAATIAALMEEKGLLNIPAMRSIPGIQAISDILDIPQDFVAEIMRGITDPISDVLSQGTDALADALSGFLGPEESAGFDDAGEVDGGAPDIEPVPPITTPEPKPEPPARTYPDVDDATRRRILANVISGLQRTDRPTEGVTAFGPLFV
jgi:hypothetical protein